MNSLQTSFRGSNRKRLNRRLVVAAMTTGVLGGCSVFGGPANTNLRDSIIASVPVGTPMAEAESTIADRGFSCTPHHGGFVDDDDSDHEVGEYLGCVKNPGRISFKCLYRDEVYVVPKQDLVSEIYVARGPTCITR